MRCHEPIAAEAAPSPDFYTGSRIDGMTVRVRAADLPLEHFDSVEVLKGAGAFL